MNHLTHSLLEKIYYSIFPSNPGTKNSYPISHYIDIFGYVLKTGIAWRDIRAPLHWSTYYKKFQLWAKKGLFQLLHQSLLSIALQKNYLSKEYLKNLFIDSTMIKNFKGIDLLGKNHYDRHRKGNKITIIVSSNAIPLSVTLTTASDHDLSQVLPAINNIPIKIIRPKLIADKGYISKHLKEQLKNTKKIHFIYPFKKTQKNTNTKLEKQLLKQRYIVENTFSWLHNYRRIRIRYEKHSSTYLQFYYFAMADLIAKKLK